MSGDTAITVIGNLTGTTLVGEPPLIQDFRPPGGSSSRAERLVRERPQDSEAERDPERGDGVLGDNGVGGAGSLGNGYRRTGFTAGGIGNG